MKMYDDPDLERRLRRVAAAPEIAAPDSVYAAAAQVATRPRTRRLPTLGFGSSTGRRMGLAFGVAAALLIAAVAGGLLLTVRSANVAASPSHSAAATASQVESARPTATVPPSVSAPTPTPTPIPQGQTFATADGSPLPADIVTDGLPSDAAWSSVAFKPAPGLKDWAGAPTRYSDGWLAWANTSMPNEPMSIWLSADGAKWHASVAPGKPFATAAGLVAYHSGQAWTSRDGATWTPNATDVPRDGDTGCSNGVGSPAGVLCISQFSGGIFFSADGIAFANYDLPGGRARSGPDVMTWSGSEFVAGQTVQDGTGQNQIFVWTSVNGTVWQGGVVAGAPANSRSGQLVATPSGILLEVLDASNIPTGWLWSSDGATWESATGVEALVSGPGVSVVTVGSNGERFLAAISKTKGPWTMATSMDGQTWTALAGQTASPGVLAPVLMPHGVFLMFQWWCADGLNFGICSTPPPGGAEYGAAR